MRCPDCNKFVSFDEADPEVNDLDVSDNGSVTASVRIVNTCAECGTELKEAMLELEESPDLAAHIGEGHTLSIGEGGCDRTGRSSANVSSIATLSVTGERGGCTPGCKRSVTGR
jgi:hypothetical protein